MVTPVRGLGTQATPQQSVRLEWSQKLQYDTHSRDLEQDRLADDNLIVVRVRGIINRSVTTDLVGAIYDVHLRHGCHIMANNALS